MKLTWTRGEKWPKGYSDENPVRCSTCGSLVALAYYLKGKHWFCGWCSELHNG